MKIVANQVGIDVSKDQLVVAIDEQKPRSFANTARGIQELRAALPLHSQIHMEATGGFERLSRRTLAPEFQVFVHNPRRARKLSEGLGVQAKTDPIDAQFLAQYGSLLRPHKLKSEEREDLADLCRQIEKFKSDRANYLKEVKSKTKDGETMQFLRQAIEQLGDLIAKMETRLAERLKESSLKDDYKLVQSIHCIGKVTAAVVLCELPEDFRERSAGQICSYAGLAPMDRSSGQYEGRRRVRRGNSRLKKAMYMPAITARVHEPWAKDLYERLIAKGRTHQQAIVALMRKLLARIVQILQRKKPYTRIPPQMT